MPRRRLTPQTLRTIATATATDGALARRYGVTPRVVQRARLTLTFAAVRRRKRLRPPAHPRAALTSAEVRRIRAAPHIASRLLGERYAVSASLIRLIRQRRRHA